MAYMVPLILLFLLVAAPGLAAHYALILDDPPAAVARSVVRFGNGPEVAAARDRLRISQAALHAELARRHFAITGSTQTLLNAIFVSADPSRLAELKTIPGVRRVRRLPKLHRTLDHAVQLVDIQPAWTLAGGVTNAGAGIKIAIIDTGIDQSHPAFQDPTLIPPSGYPKCAPEDCIFTNSRVIVARSYIRQLGAGDPTVSRPDDFSPRDHQGHGTAVAMVAAGGTNTGPADTITGVVPKAFIGNYKVFGSPGVNDGATGDVVILALEDAVADGMDIANLSLGSPALTGPLDTGAVCGEAPGTPCDMLAQAVENATSLGMLVVTAGGNDGTSGALYPALATAETPGIAPSAISVAATTNSHVWRGTANSSYVAADVTNFNAVASFSSRGPSIATQSIKPELAAVGTDMYMAAQNYDPEGDLYNPLHYIVAAGTSFSSPMVAGSAALVKQRHPSWQPAQIKSALVNTATQDATDRGNPAGVTAVGAGKLSSGSAVNASVTIAPPTLSYGTNPIPQKLQITNNGASALTLQISDPAGHLSLDQSSLVLAPGQTASLTATPLTPSEGHLLVQGDSVALQVPYLYLSGNGIPANVIPLLGDGGTGPTSSDVEDGELALLVIDGAGLPVPNLPVSFQVAAGGGQIQNADPVTNQYGIATADAIAGANPGANTFAATVAGMTVRFFDIALAPPATSPDGIVNAATHQVGPGIAPGSYISIYGTNLATGDRGLSTAYLPVAINNTSVSFDVPEAGLSVAGRLIYVSPSQVNVQVPWELQGQTSAQVKVSIGPVSGVVSTVPVAEANPGLFVPSVSATFVRGQIATLFATGLGAVQNEPNDGEACANEPCSTLVLPVVTVAGIPANVQFSGLSGGYPGLNQINFVVPGDAPPGPQPATVSVNGITSNTVMLPLQ
jgi:uncharacterized protein (TIGR03437 family)